MENQISAYAVDNGCQCWECTAKRLQNELENSHNECDRLRKESEALKAEIEKWMAFYAALPELIEPFRKNDSGQMVYVKSDIACSVGLEVK